MKLLKIVDIDEVEHTIDLQFEINFEWNDYRITFNNLKLEEYLNALREEDIKSIWLPLVLYDNTNQKETTRLGWTTEWSTSVTVTREGNFSREVLGNTGCFFSLSLPNSKSKENLDYFRLDVSRLY